MFNVVKSTVKTLMLDEQILEPAYQLYLQARSPGIPAISLQKLANLTGESCLSCRNAIVAANRVGRFPDCELHP